jgi:hypothetical protein
MIFKLVSMLVKSFQIWQFDFSFLLLSRLVSFSILSSHQTRKANLNREFHLATSKLLLMFKLHYKFNVIKSILTILYELNHTFDSALRGKSLFPFILTPIHVYFIHIRRTSPIINKILAIFCVYRMKLFKYH